MTQTQLRSAVAEALAELTGRGAGEIADGDDLVDDLGVDSMIAVNLLVTIENRLGARLPAGCEGGLLSGRTVGELTERLASAFAADGREISV